LGEYGVGVIPANTVKGMDRPETAFEIEAQNMNDAISRAAEFYERLLDKAGLEAEIPRVTAVVPSQARTRASGQVSRRTAAPVTADFERLRSDVAGGLPPSSPSSQSYTQDLSDLAERTPVAAIMEAHMRIELELRHALGSIDEDPSKSEDASTLAVQWARGGLAGGCDVAMQRIAEDAADGRLPEWGADTNPWMALQLSVELHAMSLALDDLLTEEQCHDSRIAGLS